MLQQTLEERSALSGRAALGAPERLTVTVAPDCARFSLRVAAEERDGAGRAFGAALPERIGGVSRSGERVALCLGPDEWFLLAPSDDLRAVEAAFCTLAATHSLVDVSHREVGIEVRGTAAAWALGAVSPLDLAARPVGSATRTVLDKAQVILIKFAEDHYRIEVWQSFATHVWGLLAAAAREVELDI